jgi:ABC-type cobalamin transport system permease subunit
MRHTKTQWSWTGKFYFIASIPVLLREVCQQQALMKQALVNAQAMSAEHKYENYSDI